MPNGDDIQTKYNFSDEQIRKLNAIHSQMKDYDNVPNELGKFVADLNEDESRIGVIHEQFKKYNNIPNDLEEFKSDIGFGKKKRTQPSRQQIKPEIDDVSRLSQEQVKEDQPPSRSQLLEEKDSLDELTNRYDKKKSQLDNLVEDITRKGVAATGVGAMEITSVREDVSQDKVDKKNRLEEEVNSLRQSIKDKTTEQLTKDLDKLSNFYNNVRLEHEEKKGELDSLESEIVQEKPAAIPGGTPVKVTSYKEGTSQEQIKKREQLSKEVGYKGSLLSASKDIIDKSHESLEIMQKPEGIGTYFGGFGSGISGYFKDYAEVINKIARQPAMDDLQKKVKKFNKQAAERSEQKEELTDDIDKLRFSVSEKHSKLKSIQNRQDDIESFIKELKVQYKDTQNEDIRKEFNQRVNEYNQLIEEAKKIEPEYEEESDKLNKLIDEYNEGIDVEFSDEEKLFLNTSAEHRDVLNKVKDNIPVSYEIGESTGHSLAFMSEFALTGGVGKNILSGAKVAGKGLTGGLKKFGLWASKKAARGGAQTLVMPTFIKDSAMKMTEGEKTKLGAIWDAYTDTFIEVTSERLFMGRLAKSGGSGVMDRIINRMGSAIAGRKGLKGYGLAFGEEMLEEEIAKLGHLVKRQASFSDIFKEMGDVDEQLKLTASVAIMTGAFGGAKQTYSLANNSIAKYKLRKSGEKLDKEVKDYIDSVLEDENVTGLEAMESTLRIAQDYASQENLTEKQANDRVEDVGKYVLRKMRDIAYQSRLETQQEQIQEQETGDQEIEPGIKQEVTEDQKPYYRIGEQEFDNRQEFISEVEKYKGQENVPEMTIRNDNVAADRASRILQEGLQQEKPLEEQEGLPEINTEEIKAETTEEAGYVKDQYDQSKKELESLEEGQDPTEIGKRFGRIQGRLPNQAKQQFTQQLKQKQQQFKQRQEELRQEREQEIEEFSVEPKVYETEETKQSEQKKTLQQKAKKVYDDIIAEFELKDKDKTKEQKVRESRDKLHQFIQDNRKELGKISGRAVPTMLNRVNAIKTERSFARAVNDINKYISDVKYREKVDNKEKAINKVYKKISEGRLTEKTERGRKKAKTKAGDLSATAVNRFRRIRNMMPGIVRLGKAREAEKFKKLFRAESMLAEGKDYTEIGEELGIKGAEENIQKYIYDRRRQYEKLTITGEEVLRQAGKIQDAVNTIETELDKPEPNMETIKRTLEDVGERNIKPIDQMTPVDAKAHLQILKEDLEFAGIEDKSAEEVARLTSKLEDIRKRTLEEVKEEAEKRKEANKQNREWHKERFFPKDKSVTELDTRKDARTREKSRKWSDWFEMQNIWTILSDLDQKSNEVMGGELVGYYIDLIESSKRKKSELREDYRNTLEQIQKETLGDNYKERLKEISMAPNKPKESFLEKVKRVKGDEFRVLTEEVEIKNDKGEIIDKLPLNQLVAAKKWLELQDPTLEDTFFSEIDKKQGTGMGYTQHHVKAIEEYLDDDVKQYASRIMNEFFPKFYEEFNKTYRKLNGVDMPFNEFYTPLFRSVQSGVKDPNVILEQHGQQAMLNDGHTLMRRRNKTQLEYVDLNSAIDAYMRKMMTYSAYSDMINEFKKIFNNSGIKKGIERVHGRETMRQINSFIDDVSKQDMSKEYNTVDRIATWLKNNFLFASLAAKAHQTPKQFTSVIAGLDYLNPREFGEALSWAASHPKKAREIVFENPVMKERWEHTNIDPDIARKFKRGQTKDWRNSLMFFTRLGDMLPIGILYPKYYEKAYNEQINKGFSPEEAKEKAQNIAQHQTLRWQQSTYESELSSVQRRRGLYRMFVMYSTAPLSYHRMANRSVKTMYKAAVKQKDPKAFAKGLKTFFIARIALPQIYQFFLNGMRWDDDDQLRAAYLGNANAIPITGELVNWGLNQAFDLPFDFQLSPVQSIVTSAEGGMYKWSNLMNKIDEEEEKITIDEIFSITEDLGEVFGSITGLPIGFMDYADAVMDINRGRTEYPWEDARRLMGWSQWQVTPNKAILYEKQKEVMQSILSGESSVQMLNRIRDKYGVNHLIENAGDYAQEYAMRQQLDPHYESDLITDIQQAEDNKRKKEILIREGKKMARGDFMNLLGKMSMEVRVPLFRKSGENKMSMRNLLISEELVNEILREYNKEE